MFWVSMGQFIAALGSVLGVKILTSVLSPEVYGELALGQTVVLFTNQILFGPLGTAVLRFYAPAQENRQLSAYLKAIRGFVAQIAGILVAIAILVAAVLWTAGSIHWLGLALSALLFSFLAGFAALYDGMQTGARRRAVVAWHQGLGQWLIILVAVALTLSFGRSSSLAMTGFAIAGGAVLISQFYCFNYTIGRELTNRGEGSLDSETEWRQKMLEFAWPLALWGLFSWMQLASAPWVLQNYCGAKDVGFFAVLSKLGYAPILILAGLMDQFLTPILFSRAGTGDDQKRLSNAWRINRATVAGSLGLTGTAFLTSYFLHNQIFAWFAAPEYRSVSHLLPWIILGGGLFAAGQSAALMLLTDTNTRALIAPKISTALCGVTLNLAGAMYKGVEGVVFAIVLTSLFYLVWVFTMSWRIHAHRD